MSAGGNKPLKNFFVSIRVPTWLSSTRWWWRTRWKWWAWRGWCPASTGSPPLNPRTATDTSRSCHTTQRTQSSPGSTRCAARWALLWSVCVCVPSRLFVLKRMCETAEVLASEPELQSSANGSISNLITRKLNGSTFHLAGESSKGWLSQPKLISQLKQGWQKSGSEAVKLLHRRFYWKGWVLLRVCQILEWDKMPLWVCLRLEGSPVYHLVMSQT